jgi:hypothetical protein
MVVQYGYYCVSHGKFYEWMEKLKEEWMSRLKIRQM